MSAPTERQLSIKVEVLEKMSSLAAAGFGLVAALAWNDAIQALFTRLFPARDGLWAKFAYALLITILVVFITTRIGRLVQTAKDRLEAKK